MVRMIGTVLGMAIAVYVMVVVGAYALQRQLMYFPDTMRHAPAALGLDGIAEIEIERPEGIRLVAWFKPPEAGRPTILYFHGNAGSVASRAPRAAYWAGLGYGVLLANYRGYGGSGGSPSETALVGDGLALLDHLAGRGISPQSVVLYGESLGSGVAVQVAALRDVLAVVLEAPFTSAVDIAVRAYPFLPARWLLKDRFMSMEHIAHIDAPLFIAHGELDGVIPFELGQRLFEAAVEPKSFLAVPGGGHSTVDLDGVRAAVAAFIERAVAGQER
jgi:hypothetical protein